jgi:hypothetical protein
MPMELLQALADAELPLEFTNPTVQLELRVLHDAGHIICSFPPARLGEPQPARVEMVTALGHKALRHFGPNSAFGRLGAP